MLCGVAGVPRRGMDAPQLLLRVPGRDYDHRRHEMFCLNPIIYICTHAGWCCLGPIISMCCGTYYYI
ncbi:MAG TPA: hypothetical protein HA341_05360 [Halobacteria archaeon]|nr:hypothetical protein [Halobacteria archaeon]